jgi:hypothetical protein
MEKRIHMQKQVLKKLESFRNHQRKASGHTDESFRAQQYRELQNILSPFWAWRALRH